MKLRTLAKNSASKLPELRQDFAWFIRTTPALTDTSDQNTMEGTDIDLNVSFFMHGGSIENAKTNKKKYLNDFYHLDVRQGLFRKFFLFDAAKARACHSIVQFQNEVYLIGGQGSNGTLFDDMWRFDLENVQWMEQKQADLVGLVAEKVAMKGDCPGKVKNATLLAFME